MTTGVKHIAYKKSTFQLNPLTIKKDGVLYGDNTFGGEFSVVDSEGNVVYSAVTTNSDFGNSGFDGLSEGNSGFDWLSEGSARITIPQAAINTLDTGSYSYYVRVTDPVDTEDEDGVSSIVAQGEFEVREAYTSPTALPTRVY